MNGSIWGFVHVNRRPWKEEDDTFEWGMRNKPPGSVPKLSNKFSGIEHNL